MTPIDGIDDDIETPEAQQTVEVPELEEIEAFSQEGQDLADPSNDAPFSAEDFGGAEDADDGEVPDELADAEGGEPGDWDFGEQAEETSDMQTEVLEEADPGEWDFGEQGEEMGEQKRGFWDDLKSVFDDSETEASAFADVLLGRADATEGSIFGESVEDDGEDSEATRIADVLLGRADATER